MMLERSQAIALAEILVDFAREDNGGDWDSAPTKRYMKQLKTAKKLRNIIKES